MTRAQAERAFFDMRSALMGLKKGEVSLTALVPAMSVLQNGLLSRDQKITCVAEILEVHFV